MIDKLFVGIKNVISVLLGTDDISLFLGSNKKYPLCELSTAYTASDIAASTVEASATSNTVTWEYTCVVTHVDCSTTTTTGTSSSSVTFSQNTTNSSRTISGNISWNGILVPYSFMQKGVPAYTAPTAANPTYNGSAQALVNAGSTSHGTIQYSSDGTNWGVTIPSATTAGNYTVQWKIVGDSTHSDLPAQTINVTIAKVTPTVTAPTAKSLTYTGSDQQLANAGSTNFGTLKYCLTSDGTFSTSIPSGNTAGSYTLWYRVDGDSNVNNVAAASISCSISKASGSVDTKPTAKSLNYNGSAQELVTAGSGTGTMMYKLDSGSWGTSIPSGTNATNYTVYYKASASTNYEESASGSVSVTINKVTPTVTAPTPKTLTYNGSAQQLANAGSTNFGTLQYSLDDSSYSTSVPSGTNATSYTVYYRVVGDSNVNDVAAASISCSIGKANPTYTAPTKKTDLVYTGSAQALLNAGSTSHGTIQYSSDGSTWSTSIPSGTNATSYTVYWRLIGDSNHNNVNSTSITCSIAKADPTYTAPTATSPTYNNTNQALLNAGSTSHGTIQYSSDGSTWSTTIPTGKDATTYTSYWKLVGDANHNDVASTSISTTINKVTPTVTAPVASALTYNGSAQQLAKTGSTNYGTLKYSLDGTSYSTSVPSGTNAGDYTLYYKVDGNSNVNNVAAKTIACSIAKANPTYTAPTAKSLTYNGNDQALLNAGSTSHGTIQYSSNNSTWSGSIPSGKTAGSYTSYWKLNGDANHNDVASTSISTTISKANGSVSTAPTAKSLTFNNANQELVNAGSGTGTMMYKLDSGSWGTSIPTASAATSYTVYYKASASTNYNESASGSVSVTINKVTPTVTAPTAKVLTFNNANQVLANAGSTNYGTIQYCLNNSGGTYSTTVPSASAANVTYKVWYKVVGNSNVNDVAPASIDCTIAEKRVTTPTITLDPSSYTYNGTARKPTPTVKDGSTVIPSSEYNVSYSNNTNAGTATVTISDIDLGNYYISGTTTFTINKANGSVSTAPTAKSLTYNASAQALVTAGSGTGTMMYKLDSGSWGTSIPTATNATSYTVYYKASASTNYNESASGSVSVTINKVTPTVTAPTAKSLTYTGSAQALVNAGSTNYGTLQYSSDNSTWGTSIPSGTNATSYTVYYRVVGDSNINDVASQSVACSIAKANPTYNAPTANNRTYDTTSKALLNAGSVTGGTIYYSSDNTNWSTTIPSQTNAGTYTTYWKITGDSNHNDKASASISTTVSPKTVTATVTLSQTTYTYSNSACQPTPTVKDGSTTIASSEYTVSYSNNVNVGTATCTITDKSGGNYTVSGSKTFTINCYSATAPTAKSLTYNTGAQTLANAGSTAYGTMVYCSTSGGTFSTTIPTGTNAGSYEVWWKVTGNTNVCNTAATKVACSIGAKTVSNPTITLSQSTYTYANTAFQPTPTVKDGSTTIPSSEYTVSYSNNTNVGTATCTITDKSGGNYTVSGSKTFTINCYSATAPTNKNPNWTGSAQAYANAGSTSYGTMVYCTTSGGTFTTTLPTGTNAGSYDLWWKVTGNTNVCDTAATKVACSIAKVAMTYAAPKAATRDYNGSAQQIVSGASANGGSIYYATSSAGASSSTTVPTQTAAGTYSTYWKAVPDSNHSGGTSSWAQITSCVINKVAMTYTAPKVTTYTYGNTARALVSGASANGGSIQYCATSGGTYSATVPTQTNAGTYDTWWKAVPDSNHSGGTSAAKLTTTVNCYSATAPTAKNGNWTGSAQALVNAGSTSYGTIVYSTDNSSFSTTIPSGTSAGSYTVYWKVTGNTNVCQTASTSISCSIKKVAMSYNSPAAKTGLNYTGSAQQIVSGGSATGGNIYYATSSAGASSSTTVPSQTNAGSYTVYWKAVPDSNHSGGTDSWAAISCSIAKVAMTYSAPKAAVRTYNGSAQQIVSGQSAAGGSIQFCSTSGGTYTANVPTQTNAGTYTTWWKAVPDGNHYGGTDAAQITGCTINKGSATISVFPSAKTGLVYNGNEQVLLSGGTANIDGSWSYPKGTNANTYTDVSWVFKPTDSANYAESVGMVSSVTIAKAPTCATEPKATTYTYNGSARNLVSGGSSSCGTMQYCTTASGTYTSTIPTQTNAGTYTTYWKVSNDSNHSGTSSGSVSTTIAKSATSISYATTAVTKTYGDAAFTNTLTNPSNAPLTSCTSTNTSVATVDSNGKVTIVGAGTTNIRVQTDIETTNYTISPRTAIYELTVNKATGSVTTAPTANTGLTYNGSAQYLFSTTGSGTGTMLYNVDYGPWSTSLPTAIDAGLYFAYYKASASTNYNESAEAASGVTISKASGSVTTAPIATNQTYGIGGYLCSTGSGTGTMLYKLGSGSYSSTRPTSNGLNAGNYTIYYKASASTNYNESASGSVSAYISKANGSVTTAPTAKSLTYNGSAQELVTAGSGTGTMMYKLGTGSWGTSIPTASEATTYTVYYKASASTNYNESASGSVSVTISGASYVDLGLPSGTKWAKMNVGATSANEYGNYYQYGKGASQYAATSGQSDYTGTENPLSSSVDTAQKVWGDSWRTPTIAQWSELFNNCTWSWGSSGGTYGYIISRNSKAIFLPASGFYPPGSPSIQSVGSTSYYLSSTPNGVGYSEKLYIYSSGTGTSISFRSMGCPVRPVYVDNSHDYVDFGLPSGTKWATMNVGATSATGYGNYYQYGKGASQYAATSGQSNYTGTENPLSSSVDTAQKVWGDSWHTPTIAQWNELFNYCTWSWGSSGGTYGYIISRNSKVIFLPASGFYPPGSSSIQAVGSTGYYLSSTPNGVGYSENLYMNISTKSISTIPRNMGCTVRPVI